jgi:hypothetical protein
MRETIVLTFAGLYLATLVASAAGVFVLNYALRRRLQTGHAALWRQLGSPSFSAVLLRRDDGSLWKWLSEHGYSGLDETTLRMARSLRITSFVFLSAIATLIALALVGKMLR